MERVDWKALKCSQWILERDASFCDCTSGFPSGLGGGCCQYVWRGYSLLPRSCHYLCGRPVDFRRPNVCGHKEPGTGPGDSHTLSPTFIQDKIRAGGVSHGLDGLLQAQTCPHRTDRGLCAQWRCGHSRSSLSLTLSGSG